MTTTRTLDKIPVPQVGDDVSPLPSLAWRNPGRERIEKVAYYWPELHAWEVHVIDDHGRRADTRGNPITRLVRNAGFGAWKEIGDR